MSQHVSFVSPSNTHHRRVLFADLMKYEELRDQKAMHVVVN